VYDHTRNITDEQITAVAATGGLIGAPALSYFVGPRPVRYQDVIKHIVYIANLAGVEHIALGLDYFDGVTPYSTIRQQQQADDEAYRSGMWDEGDFSPAPNSMPEGIETPDRLHALKTGLERHFSHSDVENILYGNWLRVFGACWK
jgi:membrane dipeptidase